MLRQQIFRCMLGTTPIAQIAKATGLSRQVVERIERRLDFGALARTIERGALETHTQRQSNPGPRALIVIAAGKCGRHIEDYLLAALGPRRSFACHRAGYI
jgi:hypothetical protein